MSAERKLSHPPSGTVGVLPFLNVCFQRYLECSIAFGLRPEKQSFFKAAPSNALSCQFFFVIDIKSLCKETHTLNISGKASHGIAV